MFRLIIALVIVYLIYRVGKFIFRSPDKSSRSFPKKPASISSEDLVKDSYCGTYVPVSEAQKMTINGEVLYFCSKECMEKYKNENIKKH